MKTALRFIATLGIFALLGSPAFAEDRGGQWNVRVEVLMVDLPQDKALALLPDLRDPGKIDGAVTQIIDAINHNQAKLIGYPAVQTLDGQRAVSETVIEKRYPTEFQPLVPPPPKPGGPQGAPAGPPPSDAAIPTAFETRNVGVTVEVEPHVLQNGDWIRISIVPQRVIFEGFDAYTFATEQPRFFTAKMTTTLTLRNGQRNLLAFHKLPDPGNLVELFILQAWDAPVK
jgi:hypothetical protein